MDDDGPTRALRAAVGGEVAADTGSRALYAADAFGEGCMHVRLDADLVNAAGRRRR